MTTIAVAAGERRPPTSRGALPDSFAGGRYRTKRFLGEGGAKQVFLAHDVQLDRDVAVSLIKLEQLAPGGLDRVRREAQAMAWLGDHPHIVSIYDFGDEAGRPFLVTQFMAGGDLEGLLRSSEQRRLPLVEAFRIAEQVCQALEHAHGHNVIHRDLKPGNVWLTAGGTVKLGDFGLALALDRTRITHTAMIAGTLAYMPPEQATGGPLDARADLYALGVMLYQMVTGELPFASDSVVGMIFKQINAAPPPPSRYHPAVPRPLEALVLRLLAKSPEQRPQSAAAVRQALQAIAAEGARPARLAGLPGVDDQPAPPHPQAPAPTLLDRLSGGAFVGRAAELNLLRARLEQALAGELGADAPGLVLLAGETGIGKTRAAEELTRYAGLRGVQVVWARCHEGGGAPAFWPWTQAIRLYALARDPEALHARMGSTAVVLAQFVTEIRERLPDLPPPPALQPEEERFRLFESIVTFLQRAAAEQPLLLVLDDLHWADTPSLLLLQFLARELRGARVMMLGTYQDTELERGHPLADLVADLSRERRLERVHLPGLAPAEITALLEALAQHDLDAGGIALAEALHRQTEGNPFFIQEIVRHLAETGALYERDGRWVTDAASLREMSIPQGVRDVIGRRLRQLSEPCNRALSAAAVIGRDFSLDILEQASDLPVDALLDVLEEAEAARIVVEERGAAGRYRFSHALVRQTLYAELTAARRIRLHARIGEALEARSGASPNGRIAEVAHHFLEAAPAGYLEKATEYARRAGDRALALLAYEEAVRLYEMTLRALEQGQPAAAEQRCACLLALGDARARAGDNPGAKEAFLQAAAGARTAGWSNLLARAALGLGALAETGVLDEPLIALLEEARDALGEADSALRARLLAQLSRALQWAHTPERTDALSRQAVAVARRVGDPTALAAALESLLWALTHPAATEERIAVATEILALARAAGDKRAELEGHLWRIVDLLKLGDMAATDAEMAAYTRLAEELRQPQFLWYATALQAMRALWDGRFDEAERLIQQALTIGARTRHQDVMGVYAVQLLALRRQQGRLPELEGFFRGLMMQYPALTVMRAGLVELQLALGRTAEARLEFDHLAANDFADIPLDVSWLPTVIVLAELCSALEDARRAAILYDLLLPYAGLNVVVGSAMTCLGSASRHLGLLAATRSRWDEAAEHFEEALRMHARTGALPWTAHTRYGYAAMLTARDQPGDRERATALLEDARATAQQLGMASLAEQAGARLAALHEPRPA